MMHIGMLSTRLAGTDGVSLEAAKMVTVLREMGHAVFYCAGELEAGLPGLEAPALHFEDPQAQALGEAAFQPGSVDADLLERITARAAELKEPLALFLDQYAIDFLIVQNAFAIPMQLPLAQALTELLNERNLPALAHNHDFYWERERFASHRLGDFLNTYFPPDLPRLAHAVINSQAQRDLLARRGIPSRLLPNVFDFDTTPPGIDSYNADFRAAIGLQPDDWLILQPTRVVPRKGIELAIELIARLDDPRAKLVITHAAGDEGLAYWQQLQRQAEQLGVDLRYVAEQVGEQRGETAVGEKIYTLWDVYPHADFVTYPSLYEGFGNALLETLYFRKPALVNRYAVYVQDIAPHGFDLIEIDGAVTPETVEQVRGVLTHPASTAEGIERNYQIAQEHFSYTALRRWLADLAL